jgi:hypothetical protein
MEGARVERARVPPRVKRKAGITRRDVWFMEHLMGLGKTYRTVEAVDYNQFPTKIKADQ